MVLGLHASSRFGYTAGMTTPEPKRRWYQYRLRTLLVFVLLVSIGLSWFAVKLNQARKQREAVEAITKLGGYVREDDATPPGLDWLLRGLGDDFFGSVSYVNLDKGGSRITDATLAHLKALPRLRTLMLNGTNVGNAGLEHIKGLTNLHDIWLDDTQVTDAGLEHLKGLTNLQDLWLDRTKVTDAGLERLKGLARLEILSLMGTQVTAEGVKKFQQAHRNCEVTFPPTQDR